MKPCPFCGETENLETKTRYREIEGFPKTFQQRYCIVKCPCGVQGPEMPSIEFAEEIWDRRVDA